MHGRGQADAGRAREEQGEAGQLQVGQEMGNEAGGDRGARPLSGT